MKICKNCNSQWEDSQTFCGKCGQRLEENVVVQPIQEPAQVQNPTPVVQTPMNNQVPNQNKKSNLVLIIILIVAVAIIGVLACLLLIPKDSGSEPKDNGSSSNNIEENTTNDNTEKVTKTYNVGEQVTLLDYSTWHVISVSGNKVTLLLDKLVADNQPYGNDASPEQQKYDNSLVKKYIEETYLPELKSSLEKYKGDTTNLKARLITIDEFLKLAGQKMSSDYMYSTIDFGRTDEQRDNEKWLKQTKTFWTMSNIKEYNASSDRYGSYAILVGDSSVSVWTDYSAKDNAEGYKGAYLGVRPVIETTTSNLK